MAVLSARPIESKGYGNPHVFFVQVMLSGCPHYILTSTQLSADELTTFLATTSTTSIHKHFLLWHDKEWINRCDRDKIPITAEEALPCAKQRHKDRDGVAGAGGTIRKSYTPDGFVDALVEFITADDHVSSLFFCNGL